MRVSAELDVAFAFGPFRLIPRQQVLVRESRPVKLGGRALDILHLLVMRAGEEVSKSDLIKFAWPNIFVDESNLKVHISSLRRALQDTTPHATYIATVAGRGYQFVGEIQKERAESAGLFVDDQPVACSLPVSPSLIGRQRDVEGIARALDFTSLVTLVGPGGVGKTSLAVAIAHTRQNEFPDGTYFVDLSTTENPAMIPQLLATCLGVRGDAADLILSVLEHLHGKRCLILLDNCEHVLHAAATIAARLVEAQLGSCILATSREPLGVSDENLQRVDPLAFPRDTNLQSAEEALSYPSINLFAVRALEAAGYRLVDGDAQVVAQICEVLDGLPLAIEIAAAKLDQFSPAELLNSVRRHLSELRNEDGATHSRHQTLWATLDWSCRLLAPRELTIFRLLSVFAGSFEWTDVARMAGLVQYDPYQTTMALGGLVSKSLLSAEIDGEHLRYRLLQIARCYSAESLSNDSLAQEAQHHHARLVLSLFEQSEAEWMFVDNRIWRARYEVRVGDLRKALDWCFSDVGNASLGIDLAIAAIRFWNEQSSISEQRSQVERALKHCASVTDAPQRRAALATAWAWGMTMARLLHEETDHAWEASLTFAELSSDVGRHLSVLFGHALFLIYTGRNEQAVTRLNEFDGIAAQDGDRASLIEGVRLRALAEMHLGKLISVQATLERLAVEMSHGILPSRIARYQEERYVGIHSILAFSTWLTGQPRKALAMIEGMVLKTGQIGQLMGQSHILALYAMPLTLLSGQMGALERYAAILRTNLDRENIALWGPVYRFYDAYIQHIRGSVNAVDDMRSAVDEVVHDRFLVRAPMYLGVLAEALLSRGRYAEAQESIQAALKLQEQSKEVWGFPELLRIVALTKAALGEHDYARAAICRARENALVIGARSLELRVINEMAEMALSKADTGEAIKLLLPLYGSFEDVSSTDDLRRSSRILGCGRDLVSEKASKYLFTD